MRLGWKESKWMGQLRVGARDYVHLFIPSLPVPDYLQLAF